MKNTLRRNQQLLFSENSDVTCLNSLFIYYLNTNGRVTVADFDTGSE